jgi:hypothetical protein
MIARIYSRLILFLFLMFQINAFSQSGDGTSGKYYNYAGKFKITFPGTPSVSDNSIETDMGTVVLYQFLYETETSAYMVGYTDYPADKMEGADVSQLLERAKKGFCESLGLTVSDEGTAYVGSHQGIWFNGTDNSQYYAVMRDFLVENRLYQIGILSTDLISNDMKEIFLYSFEIIE